MSFNSIPFFLFYSIVLILFYMLPKKLNWWALIAAGIFFYVYFIPSYIFVLLFLIWVDFNTARLMEVSKPRYKKYFLALSLLLNLGALFLFKYLNFFSWNLNNLAAFINWNYPVEYLELIVPLGLSFHVFQSISYVIDVYRKKWKAETNLAKYCLYVLFFPQLVAGPIERPFQLMPQLFKSTKLIPENLNKGFQRIILGLFKKVVVADHLALIVDNVYSSPQEFIGLPLVLATVAFSFQIYFDFSGYTDIAIGLARTFGINLEENFKSPYFSRSISQFWTRWHISLYNWFKDYLYFPLGGSRVSRLRHYLNILTVFLVSGLWHGASWNYIIWGGLHGFYLIIENLLMKLKPLKNYSEGYTAPKIITTFFFISAAWVFFRANSVSDALYILSHSLLGYGALIKNLINLRFENVANYLFDQGKGIGITNLELSLVFLFTFCLLFSEVITVRQKMFKWVIYLIMCLSIINYSVSIKTPFIYFQF